MMAFNKDRYAAVKERCARDITTGNRTAADYMNTYKEMINMEDYEAAKAITEVLAPLRFHTVDTHRHIKSLNQSL